MAEKKESKIQGQIHCANCMPLKPEEVTAQEWSRLEAGFIEGMGVVIRCYRCDRLIIEISGDYQTIEMTEAG